MSMSNLHVNENDSSQNGGCDFHVTIPAFKATPSSITRQSNSAYGSAGPSQQTSADVAAAIPNNPGSAVSSGSGHPHVPHEPYKGAVWSKPVRISHGRTSVRSTPRSSKAPSRSMSRTSISTCEANSSVWFERGDITIPSQSTMSLLSSPPLSSDQKPISVVNPVASLARTDLTTDTIAHSTFVEPKSGSVSATTSNANAVSPSSTFEASAGASLNNVGPSSSSTPSEVIGQSGESTTFQGSTTEALRLEILRLREENRRLHAMRRSSCEPRRSCDHGETSFGAGNLSRSLLPEAGADEDLTDDELKAEKEKLRENVKSLNSQLQMQAQVNRDLKKLVIASIGDDLQYRFETISSSRAQLDQEASYLLKSLGETKEELEKASIECDVWKSKFMASRVMVDGLASWKAALQHKQTEMERALKLFMEENENLHGIAAATNRNLTQLSASLRKRYPQVGLKDANDELPSKESKSEKPNLVEISKENRSIAQSLNFEIEALIKVAESRNLSASVGPQSSGERKRIPSSGSNTKTALNPTPASSLASEILQSETSPPPKLSNDAIAYLDILFGPEGKQAGFTYQCCENCNGEIKTL